MAPRSVGIAGESAVLAVYPYLTTIVRMHQWGGEHIRQIRERERQRETKRDRVRDRGIEGEREREAERAERNRSEELDYVKRRSGYRIYLRNPLRFSTPKK